jgi:hypothetical protein
MAPNSVEQSSANCVQDVKHLIERKSQNDVLALGGRERELNKKTLFAQSVKKERILPLQDY